MMFKDYPATQLFLLSLLGLTVLILITPFIKEWHYCAALLDSIKFIVKVICGFFFYFTIIDVINGLFSRRRKQLH